MGIQKTIQCAPHAARPSTSRRSSKSKPSAQQSHLDLYIRICGPFSMPTSAGPRYYILFIDDYTRCTFVWVLPDKKSKTCTTAYDTDIREKEKDSRYILAQSPLHSHHRTSCGKNGRVDIRLSSVHTTTPPSIFNTTLHYQTHLLQ